MKMVKNVFPKAVLIFVIFTVLCGIIYTGVITGIAQVFSRTGKWQHYRNQWKKYGSELLGQQYTDIKHMWGGRIMNIDVTTYVDDKGQPVMYASPSNLSPASEQYQEIVAERVEKIRASHPNQGNMPIPEDLVTCSGSGLDPHISVAAAKYQIQRIAKAQDMTDSQVQEIVDKCTDGRFLGIFGEETVNVLKVNLMLDGILK